MHNTHRRRASSAAFLSPPTLSCAPFSALLPLVCAPPQPRSSAAPAPAPAPAPARKARVQTDVQLLHQARPLFEQYKASNQRASSLSPHSFQRAIRARNELVARHMRMVQAVASRVSTLTCCERADLLQEGAIALIRAAERFDVNRAPQVKFSTYAYRAVCTAVWRAVAPASDIIRIPSRVRSALFQNDAQSSVPEEKRRRARQMMKLSRLDAPLATGTSGGATLGDVVAATQMAPERVMCRASLRKQVREACFRSLPKRWANVLIARYGLEDDKPRRLREVAQLFHISEPRVTQIVLAARERLKLREPHLASLLSEL